MARRFLSRDGAVSEECGLAILWSRGMDRLITFCLRTADAYHIDGLTPWRVILSFRVRFVARPPPDVILIRAILRRR